MPFSRSPGHFAFVFSTCAPLRVSQNDSSGQAVFLGQLVEEDAIYAQSSSRGSGKWRQFTTSKWSVQPPKMRSCLAGAQTQRRVSVARAFDRARGREAD